MSSNANDASDDTDRIVVDVPRAMKVEVKVLAARRGMTIGDLVREMIAVGLSNGLLRRCGRPYRYGPLNERISECCLAAGHNGSCGLGEEKT